MDFSMMRRGSKQAQHDIAVHGLKWARDRLDEMELSGEFDPDFIAGYEDHLILEYGTC